MPPILKSYHNGLYPCPLLSESEDIVEKLIKAGKKRNQIFVALVSSVPHVSIVGCRTICGQKTKKDLPMFAYNSCRFCASPYRICPICWFAEKKVVSSACAGKKIALTCDDDILRMSHEIGFCAICAQRIITSHESAATEAEIDAEIFRKSIDKGDEEKNDFEILQERILGKRWNTAMKNERKIIVYALCTDTSRVSSMIVDVLSSVSIWEVQIFKGASKAGQFMSMADSSSDAVILVEAAMITMSEPLRVWLKRKRKNIIFVTGNRHDKNNSVIVPNLAKDYNLPHIIAPFYRIDFANAVNNAREAIKLDHIGDNNSASNPLPAPNDLAEEDENERNDLTPAPSPSPARNVFTLSRKACIFCSDTEVRPALQNVLEGLGFCCETARNAEQLKEQARQGHSFIFVFAPDAPGNEPLADFIAGHHSKNRCIIIGMKDGNNSDNINAAREWTKKLGGRGFVIFPFKEEVVQKVLQPKYGEAWAEPEVIKSAPAVPASKPISTPEPSLVVAPSEAREKNINPAPEDPPEPVAEVIKSVAEEDPEKDEMDKLDLPAEIDADPEPFVADDIYNEQSDEQSAEEDQSAAGKFPRQNGEVTLFRIAVQSNGDITISSAPEVLLFLRNIISVIARILNIMPVPPTPAVHNEPGSNGEKTAVKKSDDRFRLDTNHDQLHSRLSPSITVKKQSNNKGRRNTETVDDPEAVAEFLKPFSKGNRQFLPFMQYIERVYLSAAYKQSGNSATAKMRELIKMNRCQSDKQWVSINVHKNVRNCKNENDPRVTLPKVTLPKVTLPMVYPLVALLNSAEIFFIKQALKEKNDDVAAAAKVLNIEIGRLRKRITEYGMATNAKG